MNAYGGQSTSCARMSFGFSLPGMIPGTGGSRNVGGKLISIDDDVAQLLPSAEACPTKIARASTAHVSSGERCIVDTAKGTSIIDLGAVADVSSVVFCVFSVVLVVVLGVKHDASVKLASASVPVSERAALDSLTVTVGFVSKIPRLRLTCMFAIEPESPVSTTV